MGKLLVVAYLFLSQIVFANTITVTGVGKTFEEAKQQAFKKAIEFHIGANVLSDIETRNYARVKDEIYVYSAGYVDDYKIIKQENYNQSISLTMEVTVSESKIQNRIISIGRSNKDFNNQRHTAQLSTYLQERIDGDNLLLKHLKDYPHRALKIEQHKYRIVIDERRNASLIIPYEIRWNYDYIKTLREILSVIQDKDNGLFKNNTSAVVIMVKDPQNFLFGKRTVHVFDDLQKVNLIHNQLQGESQARIVVRLKDMHKNDLYAVCYSPLFISGHVSLYNVGEQRIKQIYGNNIEKGEIKLPINFTILEKTETIELSIDADFNCKR